MLLAKSLELKNFLRRRVEIRVEIFPLGRARTLDEAHRKALARLLLCLNTKVEAATVSYALPRETAQADQRDQLVTRDQSNYLFTLLFDYWKAAVRRARK